MFMLRERERDTHTHTHSTSGGGPEREEKERIPSRLHTVSTEPDVGLELTKP